MQKFMRRFMRDSKGATAIEYGLIVSLIVIGIMAALYLFAGKTISMWTNVATVVASH